MEQQELKRCSYSVLGMHLCSDDPAGFTLSHARVFFNGITSAGGWLAVEAEEKEKIRKDEQGANKT
jgi:hypothetical protein